MHISIVKDAAGLAVSGETHAQFGHGNKEAETGPWATWNWDRERLHACVDCLGMQPLFYLHTNERVAISDSIEELIAIGADMAIAPSCHNAE